MTSNGHDTSVTTAGKYARGFLEPLLTDPAFKDTLILLTFDENHNYATPNRVFSVLLGGAVPENLRGTTDDNYYDHYSQLSTVQANWGLHHLGRYDAAANVFSLVAAKTGDIVRKHPNPSDIWLNMSYPGVFHPSRFAPISPPNLNLVVNKRTILPAIAERWKAQYESLGTVYDGGLEIPWKGNSPNYIPPTKPEPEKEDSPAGGAESKEGTAAEPGKNTGSAVSALRGSYISTDSGARAAAQEAWSWKHAAWTVVIATAAMGWLG